MKNTILRSINNYYGDDQFCEENAQDFEALANHIATTLCSKYEDSIYDYASKEEALSCVSDELIDIGKAELKDEDDLDRLIAYLMKVKSKVQSL